MLFFILKIDQYFDSKVRYSEQKTLDWDILNYDRLIWLSDVHAFDLLLNPLFGYFYCIKVTFYKNYRYNATSIGLIYTIKLKSAVHKPALNKYKFNHVNMKLFLKTYFRTIAILKVSLNKHYSKTYVRTINV